MRSPVTTTPRSNAATSRRREPTRRSRCWNSTWARRTCPSSPRWTWGSIWPPCPAYGPRERPHMAFHRFCRALLRDETITLYGDGSQSRDFTYIDDCIEANLRAWRHAAPHSVYNVGGGSQVELRAALALLERAL